MAMVFRDISFEDPDGKPITERWWFQIGKTDALEMPKVHEFAQMDNPEEHFRTIVQGNKTQEMMEIWKQLLFVSAGQRDGNMILKGPDVVKHFRYGGAYEQLFNELLESEDAGASFFASIMPSGVQDSVTPIKKEYTREQLLAMSDEDFFKAAGTKDVMQMDQTYLTLAMQRRNAA